MTRLRRPAVRSWRPLPLPDDPYPPLPPDEPLPELLPEPNELLMCQEVVRIAANENLASAAELRLYSQNEFGFIY